MCAPFGVDELSGQRRDQAVDVANVLGDRVVHPEALDLAQFRGVVDKNVEQFRSQGKQVILFPDQFKSGDLISPYEAAQK